MTVDKAKQIYHGRLWTLMLYAARQSGGECVRGQLDLFERKEMSRIRQAREVLGWRPFTLDWEEARCGDFDSEFFHIKDGNVVFDAPVEKIRDYALKKASEIGEDLNEMNYPLFELCLHILILCGGEAVES